MCFEKTKPLNVTNLRGNWNFTPVELSFYKKLGCELAIIYCDIMVERKLFMIDYDFAKCRMLGHSRYIFL